MHRKLASGALTALVMLMLTSTAASADDGIGDVRTSASSVYEAFPAKGFVKVNVTLKVTNNVADTVTWEPCIEYLWDPYWGSTPYTSSCPRTTNYYINTTNLWVENEASQLKATSSAGTVKFHKQAATGTSYRKYELSFPKIFEGQTRTINVSYVIRSGAPRSAASVRLNGAYVNFEAISQVTDQASVKIIVPSSFSTSTFGGTVKESTGGGKRIYTSGWVADPTKFYVGVFGHDLDGFAETTVLSDDGRLVLIQGWPGDQGWMDTVKAEAASSISELETLVGQPLPGDGLIAIREVAADVLGDTYGGRFFSDTQVALVPEDPGAPGTVAHELSHAWFNEGLFASTWMSEGYAGWAERAVGANAEPCISPSGQGGDTPDLGDWKFADARSTDSTKLAIVAQYGAACDVVSDVADQIGTDGMRDVMAVLSTANAAYPGTRDTTPGAAVDWRQWLDAVDEVGMVPAGLDAIEATANTLVKYGIASEADLAGRADARSALAELRQDAGSAWTIPSAIYRPLAAWDFTTSSKAITAMATTMDAVQSVASELPAVTPTSNPLRARVAAAVTLSELVEIQQSAEAQSAAAIEVSAAIDRAEAERGPLDTIGLLGVDLSPSMASAVDDVAAFEFDEVRADVAAIDQALQAAPTTGLLRLAGVLGLIAVAFVLGLWFMRHRRAPLAETLPIVEVEDSFDASDTVVGQIPIAQQSADADVTDAA